MVSLVFVIVILGSLVDMQDAWTPIDESRLLSEFRRLPEARIDLEPKLYPIREYGVKKQDLPHNLDGIEGIPAVLKRLKRQISDTSNGNSGTAVSQSSDENYKLTGSTQMSPKLEPSPENLFPISSASAGRNFGSTSLYTSAVAGQNLQIIPQNMMIPGMYTSASAGHVLSPFFYFHVPVASFFSSATAGQNPLLTGQTFGSGVSTPSEGSSKTSGQDSVALFASANAGSSLINSGDPAQNNPKQETNMGKIPEESSNSLEKTLVKMSNDTDQLKPDVEEKILGSNTGLSSSVTVRTTYDDASFKPTSPSSGEPRDQERSTLKNQNLSEPETNSNKIDDAVTTSPYTISEERLSKRNINSAILKMGSMKNSNNNVSPVATTSGSFEDKTLETHSEDSYLLLKKKNTEFTVSNTHNHTDEDFNFDDFETISI